MKHTSYGFHTILTNAQDSFTFTDFVFEDVRPLLDFVLLRLQSFHLSSQAVLFLLLEVTQLPKVDRYIRQLLYEIFRHLVVLVTLFVVSVHHCRTEHL